MDLICFDMDNTLINSEKAHTCAYNEALKGNGFKRWSFHDIVVLFGRPHKELVSMLIGYKDERMIRKIEEEHDQLIAAKYYKYARVKSGVKRALACLSKKYLLSTG